jgi:hypothetical protein
MRRLLPLLLLLGLLLPSQPLLAAPSDLELAYRWAPIHYQDTDSSDYDADYLTAVNYDGEWDTLNNWEHQDDQLSRLKAVVYYSVTETSSHWFIVYGFYHPRDWSDTPFDNTHDRAERRQHLRQIRGLGDGRSPRLLLVHAERQPAPQRRGVDRRAGCDAKL